MSSKLCSISNGIVTTAVTADQVVATMIVPAGKIFSLHHVDVTARLTTFAATATNFGTASLEIVSGQKIITFQLAHAGVVNPPPSIEFSSPIEIDGGRVVRIVCTPAATTSFTWRGNIVGTMR